MALAVALASSCADDSPRSAAPRDTVEVARRVGSSPVESTSPVETSAGSGDPAGPEATTPTETTGGSSDIGPVGRSAGSTPAPMTVTVDLDPDATWADGSPITVADVACTWRATLGPRSALAGAGYQHVRSVEPGTSERQVVIAFDQPYAAFRTLFTRLIQASSVPDCSDVSTEFETTAPMSGGPWRVESFDAEQLVLVPNEEHWATVPPSGRQVVATPEAGPIALRAGTVDVIKPLFDDSLLPAVEDPADPAITWEGRPGRHVEGLFFQQLDGPLADPVFRKALAMSIERDALIQQLYGPTAASLGVTAAPVECGPWPPDGTCPDAAAASYDPFGAAAMLTAAGWARGSDGMWAKDGQPAPTVRWMVDEGNPRRELAQQLVVPALAQLGFNVVADNDPADVVFAQRLPTLDYDMTMYIVDPPADPQWLTSRFACDAIPTAENAFAGQNVVGWCNQAATDALHAADVTVDPAERRALVRAALAAMRDDSAVLPLAQLPDVVAWRADRVGGPIGDVSGPTPFAAVGTWSDLDGDDRVVIGADEWMACLNPVTDCATTPWYQWLIGDLTLPGLWRPNADGDHVPTELVVGEPTVALA